MDSKSLWRSASIMSKEEAMRRFALAFCFLMVTVLASVPVEAAYQVGDPIADFTLYDADGVPVSLSDYEGMVIWLVFWTDT
jgi:hypothetical protein